MKLPRQTIVLLAAAAALLSIPAPALAGDITPTVPTDDFTVNTNCTLREAIQAANTNTAVDACPDPGGPGSNDTIHLGSDTYVIALPAVVGTPDDNLEGDFDVLTDMAAGNLTIIGVHRTATEIDADDLDRALHLTGGGSVSLESLSVRNGNRTGITAADRGGGIFAQSAALTLAGVEVVGSDTNAEGGGVAITHPASMTFFDSIIGPNNTAEANGGGGGIFWSPNSATPTLTLQGTEVRGNVAETTAMADDVVGGGVASVGKLTINSGVISGNSAIATDGARGGGLSHTGSFGPVTMNNVRISQNFARSTVGTGTAAGGGIRVFGVIVGTSADLNKVTLDGNFVDSPTGAIQQGGGIQAAPPNTVVRLVNSTVSGNLAPDAGGDGGGIYDDDANLRVIHTTFAGNDAADEGDAVRLDGTTPDGIKNSIVAEGANACGLVAFTSAGGNVDADDSCWVVPAAADIQNAPPQLGPLAANGFPFLPTHGIAVGSPARDRVPLADCEDETSATVTEDSRGVARPKPAGGLCDSGSYELIVCNGAAFDPVGPFTSCPPPATNPTPATPAPGAKKKKCKKKKKKKRSSAAAKKKCKKKKRK
jgi:CSLREA domain-containing protein